MALKSSATKLAWRVLAGVVIGFGLMALAWNWYFDQYLHFRMQNEMYPTLPSGSEFVGVRQPYREASEVKRGDIVAFTRKFGASGEESVFIGRVIALPGDTVSISDAEIIINGRKLARDKVRLEADSTIYKEANGDAIYEVAYETKSPPISGDRIPLNVPPNQLVVLGDNRGHAKDSREFGPIAFQSIVARRK